MKAIYISLTILLFSVGVTMAQNQHNVLSDEEKQEGWILLFDGETTEGWRSYNGSSFPSSGWVVEDGTLVVEADGGGGDIITTETYGDFILEFEWKVDERANSGVFYRAMEQPSQPIYWSAPEFQILDNKNHPDADMGENGNRKSASLYDLLPAQPQNARSYGEWNSARIVADGSKVQHWQNGEKVVEFELWTSEWYELIRNSKFLEHPEFGDARKGYIGLQDHGDRVSFRNIKLKPINLYF